MSIFYSFFFCDGNSNISLIKKQIGEKTVEALKINYFQCTNQNFRKKQKLSSDVSLDYIDKLCHCLGIWLVFSASQKLSSFLYLKMVQSLCLNVFFLCSLTATLFGI